MTKGTSVSKDILLFNFGIGDWTKSPIMRGFENGNER